MPATDAELETYRVGALLGGMEWSCFNLGCCDTIFTSQLVRYIKGLAKALEEKRILLEEIQALKAEKSKLSTERSTQSATPSPRVAAPTPKSTPAPSRSPSDETMDSDDDEACSCIFMNDEIKNKYILKVQHGPTTTQKYHGL